MAPSADADWVEIERLVRETSMSLREIALRTGVSSRTLSYRSARQGWRPSEASGPRPTLRTRRTLILRFYRAIDKKLQQMESRMEKEIESGEGASTSADHERDARTIGGLINQLGKLSEYETGLDRPAGQGDAAVIATLAAETDRYRRELVERLARLFPPPQ